MSVYALKIVSGKGYPTPIPETDTIYSGGFARATSGAVSLWGDSNTTGITLGGGSCTGTVDIGNTTGAATLTGAGVNLAGGSSEIDITTTGALDLNSAAFTLDSSSTIDVNGSGAINIDSSAGAIGIGTDDVDQNINIGTQGERSINVATGAFASTVTVGNNTGATTVALETGSGGLQVDADGNSAMAFAGTLDMDATGAVSMNSSGGAINIGNDADSQAINIGTGAAARTITMGNNSGASALNLVAGTGEIDVTGGGAIDINATGALTLDSSGGAATITAVGINLAAGASEIDLTTTGAIDLNGGTMTADTTTTMAFNAGSTLDLDAATALSINSSGGAINIGNDDIDQAINIGTTGERTITIGNAVNTTVAITSANGTTITGDAVVTGDLTVQGTTFTTHAEQVNIDDNTLYLNNAYTTAVAQTGGLAVNYLPTATSDTVAATGFTAGVPATSNPTVSTTGGATFSASDLIQISGAANESNNGLFEVLSHAANLLTIRGIGLTGCVEDFTQNQFVTDTTVQGTITKVNVSVIRAGTDGDWEVGKGSATGISFTDLGVGNPDLSTVLGQGNTSGAHNIIMADDRYIYFGTDSDASIRYDETTNDRMEIANSGAGGIYASAASGPINLTAAGSMIFDCATVLELNSSGGVISIGNDAVAQNINIGTGAAARIINVGNTTGASGLNLQSGTWGVYISSTKSAVDAVHVSATSGGMDVDLGTNGFDLDATGAVNIDSSAGQIQLQSLLSSSPSVRLVAAHASGGIELVSLGDIDFTASKTSTWQALNSTASTDITLNLTASNTGAVAGDAILDINSTSTNGTGSIDVDADDTITIDTLANGTISVGADAVAGSLNFGTGGAAKTVTVGSTNGASATTLQSGTGGVSITCTATADISLTAADNAASDILFTAHAGSAVAFNDATYKDLTGWTATSIIGALNEAAGLSRTTYTGGAGGITQYYGVYISANNTVLHSSATADNIASHFIGVAPAAIGAAGTGFIVTEGAQLMVFDGALSVTAGDTVYMSETAGKATNVAPSNSGSVVHEIGYIKDTSDYAGNTRCVVQLRPGARFVNA